MVFITGDCHSDFRRFEAKEFPMQKEMTRDDIVIICGDFGGVWDDCEAERYRLDWLEDKPFTVVFVDGNHENFDRLDSGEFPIEDFHGGIAQKIRPHIWHLLRGEIYDFDGKKFWCFGGASSHDIDDGILDPDDYKTMDDFIAEYELWCKRNMTFRVNHLSWWSRELPSNGEMDHGIRKLEESNFEVDYIITHCCPQDIASFLGFRESDIITSYFSEIARKTKFIKWHFGHYHGEESVWGKFILHYEKIERIL